MFIRLSSHDGSMRSVDGDAFQSPNPGLFFVIFCSLLVPVFAH